MTYWDIKFGPNRTALLAGHTASNTLNLHDAVFLFLFSCPGSGGVFVLSLCAHALSSFIVHMLEKIGLQSYYLSVLIGVGEL